MQGFPAAPECLCVNDERRPTKATLEILNQTVELHCSDWRADQQSDRVDR